jgi:hypothetical protein
MKTFDDDLHLPLSISDPIFDKDPIDEEELDAIDNSDQEPEEEPLKKKVQFEYGDEFPYKPQERPYIEPSRPDPYGSGTAELDKFKRLLAMYPEEKRIQNPMFMERQWDYWIRKGIKADDIITGLDYLVWKYKCTLKNRKGTEYQRPLPVKYWMELWVFLRDEGWIKEKSDSMQSFPKDWFYDKMNLLVSRPYRRPKLGVEEEFEDVE